MKRVVQTTVRDRATGKRWCMDKTLKFDRWYYSFDLDGVTWSRSIREAFDGAKERGRLVDA